MTEKYAELRQALPELIAEAGHQGGKNRRAEMIIALLAERDALKEALNDVLRVMEEHEQLGGSASIYGDNARAALEEKP